MDSQRIGLVMGDLCNNCFDEVKTIIWYNNSDGMIEYCLDVLELVKHFSVNVIEKQKDKFRVLLPEVRDFYNDLSAHKDWRKEDQLFVHRMRGRYTLDEIRVIKYDDVFYFIDQSNGLPRETGADTPDTVLSSEHRDETSGSEKGRNAELNSYDRILQDMFD